MDDLGKREMAEEHGVAVERLRKKRQEDPTWVENIKPDEFDPKNLVRNALAKVGFHLRFEPKAIGVDGRVIEGLSAVHIDDPEEKSKYQAVKEQVLGTHHLSIFVAAYHGNLDESDLGKLKFLGDDERKALLVLSYAQKARVWQELNDPRAKDSEEEAAAFGVKPYSPGLMMHRIELLVRDILAERPELRP